MTPHAATVEAFIAALAGPGAAVTWQAFDDRKPKGARFDGKAAKLGATVDQALRWLGRKQDDGCGAFVTVNASRPGHRLTTDITAVRALFCDFDRGRPAQPWHVPPSIKVQTGPAKWHAYWLTDDCPLEDFRAAQQRLAAYYGSDPSINDLPRVMRVPGTYHQKGDPRPVRLLHCDSTRYSTATLLASIPPLPAPTPRPPMPDALRQNTGTRADYRQFRADRFAADFGLQPVAIPRKPGKYWIACPWQSSHSDQRQGCTDTVLWVETGKWPTFKCFHASCTGRRIADLMALVPDLAAYC